MSGVPREGVEKNREIERYSIQRGLYPYDCFAVQLDHGQYVLADTGVSEPGDIVHGSDGGLYMVLGRPYWRGEGVPDNMKEVYLQGRMGGGNRCVGDFLGIRCDFNDDGQLQLGGLVLSSYGSVLRNGRVAGMEHLNDIHAPFRDVNSSIDWQKLMDEVDRRFVVASIPKDPVDHDFYEREIYRARSHRLRVLLYRVALEYWEQDVAKYRCLPDWEVNRTRSARAKKFLETPGSGSPGDLFRLLQEYGVSDELLFDDDVWRPGVTLGQEESFRRPCVDDEVVHRRALVENAVRSVVDGGHKLIEVEKPKGMKFKCVGENLYYDEVQRKTLSVASLRSEIVHGLQRSLALELWAENLIGLSETDIGSVCRVVSQSLRWGNDGKNDCNGFIFPSNIGLNIHVGSSQRHDARSKVIAHVSKYLGSHYAVQ